jgi:lipopolysaccharide/colanic/teichoic acid biosynthesis glycosyltransferase
MSHVPKLRIVSATSQPEAVRDACRVDREHEVLPGRYHRYSGLAQRGLAALLLIPALPAMLLAMALVRCTSRGPVVYRQVRLGMRAKRFVLYKIRTMVTDAEAGSGPVWARVDDPRVTPVGRVLRAIGWDELPQLFNIVKGEMSFIGPRPERPEIAAWLVDDIPNYFNRVVVRPGITGLAQINLSADTQLDDVRRKLQLDLEYIDRAGPLLDLRIALATLPRLLGVRGVQLAKWLGVWRAAPQPSLVLAMRFSAAEQRWSRLELETDDPSLVTREGLPSILATCRRLAQSWLRRSRAAGPERSAHNAAAETEHPPSTTSRWRGRAA